MDERKFYHDFCTGCGMCCGVIKEHDKVTMKMEEDGFYYPILNDNEEMLEICRVVCPVNGNEIKKMSSDNIWGNYCNTFFGWSTDDEIRHSASSGGILTALSVFILAEKMVDGIIHFAADSEDVTFGKVYCTKNSEDIKTRNGSRYCSSVMFENFKKYLEDDNKYAFIGKPCDVRVLKNYLEKYPQYQWKFPYTFSFFCAGAPSEKANQELLNKLDCKKEDCQYLRYRGNGWPGYATAYHKNGETTSIDYQSSWRDTLGRDIRRMCRFCIDGVGELADISCGDAWYLNKEGKPDFTESKGRNIIFARTQEGMALLKQAEQKGYLHLESNVNIDDIEKAQKYQYVRKAAMKYRVLALKLAQKDAPKYPKEFFKNFDKLLCFNDKIHIFYGTLKRIIQKKI